MARRGTFGPQPSPLPRRLLLGRLEDVNYVSTRGLAPALGFSEVLLAGLARDGGLYMPETWPQFGPAEISGLAGLPYPAAAVKVMRPFVGGEISDRDLLRMADEAYATFRDPAVAPLRELKPGLYVLELFHGPTLAFKDVALQLLARLMDHVLRKRGQRVTIVGATSGDTGGAAVEAFRGRDNADLFILFPEGRVSPFQQRQMTTAGADNVHAIAVKGTFDDCQAIVKALFNDQPFRDRVALAGVNSINWARILAQIVYYFTAAVALGAPKQAVSFTVPTGNFGDIFAGYAAKRMGLPIDRLVVATNSNDILARTLDTGRYELRPVVATTSPSMDIQISSNFERLLFDACGRDGATVRALLADLADKGGFTVPPAALATIRADFAAGRADEAQTAATIAAIYKATGFLPDPHTAVGLAVAERSMKPGVPMVALATAHPAKFGAAVKAAAGIDPSLPDGYPDIMGRPERFATLGNDPKAIKAYIADHVRSVPEKV
jgi:threonine synthase